MTGVVIVAARRSPMGRAHKGSLAGVRPDDLAATVIAAALADVPGLESELLDDLMLGCAEPHDEHGANLARRVSVLLGLDTLPGVTVNRFCASSAQTTRMAFHAIRAGEGEAFVSAGVDCVSRYIGNVKKPEAENERFRAAMKRTAQVLASGARWRDPRLSGELPNMYISMGLTAEIVAKTYGITREEQDEFAARSQMLAAHAQDAGYFDREVVVIPLPDGSVFERDECIRRATTVEVLSGLPPIFLEGGSVTAGNACPLNDGAAALIVMSERAAKERDIAPLGRVVATAVGALSPEIMGLGPVEATREVLGRAGMTLDDVDLVEINEAFAAQVIASARELELPLEKVNTRGGAIALGHPYGATGARLIGTLLNGLKEDGGRFGLATMCVGGGQGMAVVVERL